MRLGAQPLKVRWLLALTHYTFFGRSCTCLGEWLCSVREMREIPSLLG